MESSDELEERNRLTKELKEHPYSIPLYLQRCKTYGTLGFPDLAAMDAYKALLLVDEVVEESGEYHEEALKAAKRDISDLSVGSNSLADADMVKSLKSTKLSNGDDSDGHSKSIDESEEERNHDAEEDEATNWANNIWVQEARMQLAHHLTSIGCLRTAYDFIQQALRKDSTSKPAHAVRDRLFDAAGTYFTSRNDTFDQENINVNDLPDRGFVRREIYPWNHHEADRTTPEALDLLNQQMKAVAPKLEVRVTELPVLSPEAGTSGQMSKQLGVFATTDLQPGEQILHERSLLTANSRLHEPHCDACSSELPDLTNTDHLPPAEQDNPREPVPCEDCEDVFFCSQECHDLAQESYHPAVCGLDIESISREVPAAEAADALYTLLLLRTLAMAQTQQTHPLDLKEVKYIWGDFKTPPPAPNPSLNNRATTTTITEPPNTLPFTFTSSIHTPLHLLSHLSLPPFTAPHDLAETWLYNTLYAKFRGTASARLSTRDGRPEVAAVHPLWCLANHSCDPNVGWEWAGDIRFVVRERRKAWGRGERSERSEGSEGSGRVEQKEQSEESERSEGLEGNERREGVDSMGKGERKGGIPANSEILSHYVDVDLPVKERREWGVGALGGFCRCERCVWEAGEAAGGGAERS